MEFLCLQKKKLKTSHFNMTECLQFMEREEKNEQELNFNKPVI